jgi:hypothetical protein
MSVTKKEKEIPLAPQWAICLPEGMSGEIKFGPMAILNVWHGSKAFLVSGSSTVLVRQNYGSVGTRKKEEGSLKAGRPLHGLKLINALFGVALPDLAQGLVFVSSQSHVLSMDHVIGSLLGLISGIGQL